MADDLGTTVPVIGQAATVPLFVAAIAGLAAGPLADLFGFKPVLISGLVLIVLSAAGAGLATTFEILLAARVLAGLGAAATVGTAFALTGESHGYESRQRALSFVAAAFSVSAVLGIPLLTAIEGASGWRGAMFSIAIAGTLLAVSLARLLSDPNRDTAASWPGLRSIYDAYRPLVRDLRMVAVFLGIIGVGMGTIGAVTYIGSYFVDEFGTSTGRVGLLLAVSGGSYTVGSVIGGTSLFDFRVKGTTLGLGLLSGGAMWAVFGLDSGPVVAVGAIVISLLVAGILNIMFVTVLSYESNAGAATTMAMQASVTNLGSALGVAIGGLMLGIQGYDALGLFAGLSFVMAGIVATGSLILLSFQPRGGGPERGVPIVGNSARPHPGEGEQR
ncbi:MAG: MFS transporter [Thermomicrobiales bacterium]